MTEQQACEALGFTAERLQPCQNAPSLEVAKQRLAELKVEGHRRYRALALELHPDRTGGCDEKAARFRALTAAWTKLKVSEMQPPQPVVRIVIGSSSAWWPPSSTSSSTTNW